MSEKGIYLEVNNISSVTPSLGKRHSYLVYRDGKGNERVIRGGPASMLGWLVGGDIKVEADVPLSQSIDCYAPGEKPGSRPSRKLDLGGRAAETVWADMVKEAKRIDGGQLDYDVNPPQTSNSVTRALLKAGRIDADKALPPGITKDRLTGFDNDLSVPNGSVDQRKGSEGRGRRGLPVGPGPAGLSPSSATDAIGKVGPQARISPRRDGTSAASSEAAMAKPVSAWTEDDARAVMTARIAKPMGDAERNAMAARERAFFRHTYGDGPARHDATGRLVAPEPFRPPGEAVRTAPPTAAPEVTALQKTLNDLGPRVAGEGDWTPLKEDGVAGPITTQVFEGIAPRLAPLDFARRFGRFLGLP